MDIRNIDKVGSEPFVVRVTVFLQQGVLDVQGRTIRNALANRYTAFDDVRVGKVIDLVVQPEAQWQDKLKDICDTLLTNPVMEVYEIEVVG